MSKGLNWSRARKSKGTEDGLREFRRERELAELAAWIDKHGGRKVDAGTKWIGGIPMDAAAKLIAVADKNKSGRPIKKNRSRRNRKSKQMPRA